MKKKKAASSHKEEGKKHEAKESKAFERKEDKKKSPFRSLGKNDQEAGQKIGNLQKQGKRQTGVDLLKKAMGMK